MSSAARRPDSADAGQDLTLPQRPPPNPLQSLSGPGHTEITDEQLIVLNGVPVRKLRAVTTRRLHVFDEQRRQLVPLDVPFERVIFTSSPGL